MMKRLVYIVQGDLYNNIKSVGRVHLYVLDVYVSHAIFLSRIRFVCVVLSSAHAVRLLVSVKHNEWDQCEEATGIIYVDASRHQATLGLDNLEVFSLV